MVPLPWDPDLVGQNVREVAGKVSKALLHASGLAVCTGRSWRGS
jgi:hypothetical protein